jgi:hypothetical protein
MAADNTPTQLLELPESCLLQVLQYCADDLRSIFSAARAHPRLHQAALLAITSITTVINCQQQASGLLVFLDTQHGQHIDSINLRAPWSPGAEPTFNLCQLPPGLQLGSLELSALVVQLQPRNGFQGVLRPGVPFKKLCLTHCTLLDGTAGLAAALLSLPGLQHLSIEADVDADSNVLTAGAFPAAVLSSLQQLTYLNIDCQVTGKAGVEGPVMQHLGYLTRLVELRLCVWMPGEPAYVSSSMLSSLQCLTLLELKGCNLEFTSNTLACLSQLQHVKLRACYIRGAEVGFAELLSGLQHLSQLTSLGFIACIMDTEEPYPVAAAFSALTASSKLQSLTISECLPAVPEGIWQHVFPTGRQLPHLTSLDISHPEDHDEDSSDDPEDPYEDSVAAPEPSNLVTCCPGLLSLNMLGLQCSTASLATLQELNELQQLCLHIEAWHRVKELSVLTGLQHLEIVVEDY